ncbi:DUF1361 domain-containing protein [Cellulomonas cellasea]|uniref:DUF1361 domain-containing protein n=2 Tax=Cellulomonas cellasea TaxID=43670 RepID=A0A0A0BBX6_9CELL|nr:DUF1361 domain-containing protein [Cellulomonas cellasea]KGM03597.1 hypothetical protein Q760_00420 [Cellulomonas cellasea DSM 20118]GEA87493.1 hypothetical protein CCE01nite_14420 [Cellulomonas cellasea]
MLDSLIGGVLGMDVFAAVLVLARARVFGTRLYRPMLLNLALCAAPLLVLLAGLLVVVLTRLAGAPDWVEWLLAGVTAVVWLLLLPNAGYLVTELNLSHRRDGDGVPMWFDIGLVIGLAMAGVLTTVLNVFAVHLSYALLRYGDRASALEHADGRVLVGVLLLLVWLGMYLGRYLRLNSWDVTHPTALVRKLHAHVVTERQAGALVGFCVTHTVFFALMYVVVIGPVVAGLAAAER